MSWYWLETDNESPPWNMAIDEALLENASHLGCPVLRFYTWDSPAATFGYFQNYAEIARTTSLRPLIRRPTGGGLVPHDNDWTYSLVFPPSHPWYHLKAPDSYQRLHEWMRAAFRLLDLNAELAPAVDTEGPGQCFVGAEQFDLLWQNRKVGGAAQRRTRLGLLIQGSIQPPPPIPKNTWKEAVAQVTAFRDSASWKPLRLEGALLDRCRSLSETKYSVDSYNQRR